MLKLFVWACVELTIFSLFRYLLCKGRIVISNTSLGIINGHPFENIRMEMSQMELSSNVINGSMIENLNLHLDIVRPLGEYEGNPNLTVVCSSPLMRLKLSWIEYVLMLGTYASLLKQVVGCAVVLLF